MAAICKYCSASYEPQPGRPLYTCPECWKPIHVRQMRECRERRDRRELHASILRLRRKVKAVAKFAEEHAAQIVRENEEAKRLHRQAIFPCEIGSASVQDAVRSISESAISVKGPK